MSMFRWIGDNAILYKGRICMLSGNDGWEVIRAIHRVDEEEKRERERLKEEIKSELLTERKENDCRGRKT